MSSSGDNTLPTVDKSKMVGPHPSHIVVARPYILDKNIQTLLEQTGVSESREDMLRLQGVTWIDNVRRALRMPIMTFCTACVFYHKFRLMHHDSEYQWSDAACAALFTASKTEDTLKKSREILCAAYNLKATSSAEHLTADDPVFESPSRIILGLERLMLESAAFDFRSRHPHKLIAKLAKYAYGIESSPRCQLAFEICMDIHRTFSCLKQTTSTMAMSSLELAGRLTQQRIPEIEEGRDYKMWNTNRIYVMECMRDLLDLYTSHRNSTFVGAKFPIESFINIRIALNQEAESKTLPRFRNALVFPRYTMASGKLLCDWDPSQGKQEPVDANKTPHGSDGSGGVGEPNGEEEKAKTKSYVQSPATPGGRPKLGQKDTTVRFMLDPEKAREEKAVVDEYFEEEFEEFEEWVEEVPEAKGRSRDGRESREGRDGRDGRESWEKERDREGEARDWDRDRERDRERHRDRDRERERERERESRDARERDYRR